MTEFKDLDDRWGNTNTAEFQDVMSTAAPLAAPPEPYVWKGHEPWHPAVLEWRGLYNSRWIWNGFHGRNGQFRYRNGYQMRMPSEVIPTMCGKTPNKYAVAQGIELDLLGRPERMTDEEYAKLGPERVVALRRIVIQGCKDARKRASNAGRDHRITATDTDKLLWAQGFCCAISGLPFQPDAAEGTFRSAFRPSLDRINPAKGYTPTNIRLVLTIVNIAMNQWGEAPLIEVAKAIAAKQAPSVHGSDSTG